MDIPIGVEVFCTDGLCGRTTRVVLRPKTEDITHLVVKEKGSPHREILIPITAVTATTPDSVNLRYTKHEMAGLQPFIETDYVQVDVPSPTSGIYYMMPHVYPEVETLPVKHKAIPADELAVRRGAWVEATDGPVGRVDEFLVDPESDHITHLVLRREYGPPEDRQARDRGTTRRPGATEAALEPMHTRAESSGGMAEEMTKLETRTSRVQRLNILPERVDLPIDVRVNCL
jgi:sporulation protein YlmC with PRC-barrel domain